MFQVFFLLFLTGSVLTFSQEENTPAKHKPVKNPIIDYNISLENLLKEESEPQVNLTGSPVPINGEEGSVRYLEEKTLILMDRELGKTIISNLFLDESLFKVNKDGSYTCYYCACMPDITINIISRSDGKKFKISYFDSGEIQSPVLYSQRPLEREKAEQLNRIFTELGLINKEQR